MTTTLAAHDRRYGSCWPLATPAFAQEAPDAMVKRVSQDVLATIKADPLIQAGNQARIRDVIEVKLVPNFDFTRMTALAMGKQLAQRDAGAAEAAGRRVPRAARAHLRRRAQPVPQRDDRLQAAQDESGRHRGHGAHAGDEDRAASRSQIDYTLEKTPDGWKAYDVIVAGVSLVTNYRDEFNDADQERRHRRPHQDARRPQQGNRREMTLDCAPGAGGHGPLRRRRRRARAGRSRASLTFVDAGPALEAATRTAAAGRRCRSTAPASSAVDSAAVAVLLALKRRAAAEVGAWSSPGSRRASSAGELYGVEEILAG